MKILAAIVSDDNAEILARKTMSWLPRGGFDFRVFIPNREQLVDYCRMVDDVNYEDFMDVTYGNIVPGHEPTSYARRFYYDLLLTLPDDMRAWKRNNNRDKMVIDFAVDVGAARAQFSSDDSLQEVTFSNGVIMKRL